VTLEAEGYNVPMKSKERQTWQFENSITLLQVIQIT